MKIQFLGTGAAEGVPAIFCHCPTCEEIRRRGEGEYHTRSQLVIDEEISIDFSPDAYYRSLRLNVDLAKLKYLLVTHSHMDHFYAHDFILHGYKYASTLDAHLHIFGNAEVKKVFDECTRRELKPDVAKSLTVQVVQPFQPFTFGKYTAVALKAQHSQEEIAYVYLIECEGKRYLHLTDTGRLPKETLDYLEGYLSQKNATVDFVVFDCTFLYHTAGEISRHMGLEDNRAMQQEFIHRNIADGHTRYAITHYSHNAKPLKERLLQAEQEYGYQPAFDGMKIEF